MPSTHFFDIQTLKRCYRREMMTWLLLTGSHMRPMYPLLPFAFLMDDYCCRWFFDEDFVEYDWHDSVSIRGDVRTLSSWKTVPLPVDLDVLE